MKKDSIEKKIIRHLKDIGIYRKEYNDIIRIYAGMLLQYQVFEAQFIESGFKIEEEYTNKAGATNMRKVPLYTAMESLRKDLASYSTILGLNPKSLENITKEKEETGGLAKVLSGLG